MGIINRMKLRVLIYFKQKELNNCQKKLDKTNKKIAFLSLLDLDDLKTNGLNERFHKVRQLKKYNDNIQYKKNFKK